MTQTEQQTAHGMGGAVYRPDRNLERTAARQLVRYLERLGVPAVFGLCGHTNIAVLDALKDSRVRFMTVHHEQVATHMADGFARAARRPGVALLHVGPGLINGATGVATAALDSIPLVVIAGDVPSYYFGRHPHQEINYRDDGDQFSVYKPFVKRAWRVGRVDDLPRIIERAFHLAQAGRPGPVLVDVPMDLFSQPCDPSLWAAQPPELVRPALDAATAEAFARALITAQRPVLFVGGGVHLAEATAELAALAEHLDLPVAHTLMGTTALPSDHPLLLGMTGFWGTQLANDLCKEADVILAVGTRFGEADSSSWDPRFTFRIPPTRLLHIDIDAAEIGRNFPTELGAVADARKALRAILEAARALQPGGIQRPELRERIAAYWQQARSAVAPAQRSDRYPLMPERILAEVRAALPADAFLVTDVGWNKNGVGQQFPFSVPGTFITPGGLSTMGFGPAAALGVKVAAPERKVVALVGDGAFASQMSVVSTAVEHGINVVWVVMNNAAFGTIAGLQTANYGNAFGCVFARNGEPFSPDYAAVARGCGADGIRIERAEELGPAIRRALAADRPVLLDVPMENTPVPTTGHWNILDIYQTPC